MNSNLRKIKILYVSGSGRCGSTILGSVLGQIDGFFNGGELRYIWGRSLRDNRLCECGAPFKECEFWQRVIGHGPEFSWIDTARMMALQKQLRTRHLLLMSLSDRKRLVAERMAEFPERVAQLYSGIIAESGARVIVDVSKIPSYACMLDTLPDVELYVLHMVRDPRAVAFSWGRRKKQPDKGPDAFMQCQGLLKSTAFWDMWNLACERFWGDQNGRYMLLRYEDFVEHPRESVHRIMRMVGHGDAATPFCGEREVELRSGHTVSGNPVRFRHGRVALKPDLEWKHHMPVFSKLGVTLLSLPLLLKYGYRVK